MGLSIAEILAITDQDTRFNEFVKVIFSKSGEYSSFEKAQAGYNHALANRQITVTEGDTKKIIGPLECCMQALQELQKIKNPDGDALALQLGLNELLNELQRKLTFKALSNQMATSAHSGSGSAALSVFLAAHQARMQAMAGEMGLNVTDATEVTLPLTRQKRSLSEAKASFFHQGIDMSSDREQKRPHRWTWTITGIEVIELAKKLQEIFPANWQQAENGYIEGHVVITEDNKTMCQAANKCGLLNVITNTEAVILKDEFLQVFPALLNIDIDVENQQALLAAIAQELKQIDQTANWQIENIAEGRFRIVCYAMSAQSKILLDQVLQGEMSNLVSVQPAIKCQIDWPGIEALRDNSFIEVVKKAAAPSRQASMQEAQAAPPLPPESCKEAKTTLDQDDSPAVRKMQMHCLAIMLHHLTSALQWQVSDDLNRVIAANKELSLLDRKALFELFPQENFGRTKKERLFCLHSDAIKPLYQQWQQKLLTKLIEETDALFVQWGICGAFIQTSVFENPAAILAQLTVKFGDKNFEITETGDIRTTDQGMRLLSQLTAGANQRIKMDCLVFMLQQAVPEGNWQVANGELLTTKILNAVEQEKLADLYGNERFALNQNGFTILKPEFIHPLYLEWFDIMFEELVSETEKCRDLELKWRKVKNGIEATVSDPVKMVLAALADQFEDRAFEAISNQVIRVTDHGMKMLAELAAEPAPAAEMDIDDVTEFLQFRDHDFEDTGAGPASPRPSRIRM